MSYEVRAMLWRVGQCQWRRRPASLERLTCVPQPSRSHDYESRTFSSVPLYTGIGVTLCSASLTRTTPSSQVLSIERVGTGTWRRRQAESSSLDSQSEGPWHPHLGPSLARR